jgi:hypothetical protein
MPDGAAAFSIEPLLPHVMDMKSSSDSSFICHVKPLEPDYVCRRIVSYRLDAGAVPASSTKVKCRPSGRHFTLWLMRTLPERA